MCKIAAFSLISITFKGKKEVFLQIADIGSAFRMIFILHTINSFISSQKSLIANIASINF